MPVPELPLPPYATLLQSSAVQPPRAVVSPLAVKPPSRVAKPASDQHALPAAQVSYETIAQEFFSLMHRNDLATS